LNYYNWNAGPGVSWQSSISDEVHVKGNAYIPHAVQHTKVSAAGFSGGTTFLVYPSPIPDADLKYNGVFAVTTIPSIPAFPAGALTDSLASLVSGNIKTQLSLPIFFIEGLQTLRMLRNPFGLLKALGPDNLLKNKASFREQVGKLTAASLLSKGASIWLEHLFGWKQFKNDVDESSKALATFLNHPNTKAFMDQDKRWSVSSKQIIVSDGTEYTVGTDSATWDSQKTTFNWHNDTSGMFRLSKVDRQVVYRLGCYQRQNMYNRIVETQRLLQLSGSEVNWWNIRDTIWNVLPFTFVIDWFVDFRGIWQIPNFVRLSLADVKYLCYSTKYTLEYKVDWIPSPKILYWSGLGQWGYKLPIARFPEYLRSDTKGSLIYYQRNLGFPQPDNAVQTAFGLKGLTWSRMTTGASLFAQRVFQTKNRA